MARDGSGVYTRPDNSFSHPIAGTTISPTDAETTLDDIETAISDSAIKTPQYVTLATSASLPNERVLTAGTGTSLTDGGAGSTLTIGLNARIADIAGITFAQGDILYYNGTNLVKLSPGTSGHFLKTQGAGANPVYAAVPGGGDLLASNNLSDVTTPATAFTNIKQAASTTATGVAELATAAEMVTGTDAARVPSVSVVQNHKGVAKGWAFVDTDGVLLAGYNITSAKNSTGNYALTIGTDMSSANYVIIATAQSGGIFCMAPTGFTAGAFTIETRNLSNANTDSRFYVAIFGDQ